MIKVLKQMVDVLEYWDVYGGLHQPTEEAIEAGKQAIAELESQEPVSTIEDLEQEIYQNTRNFVSRDVMEWMLKRYYTNPPQRTEQNFCSRCGKRTKDSTHIHTCTPPQD